jgi:hypothetical protein
VFPEPIEAIVPGSRENMATSIIVASVAAFWDLVVWFLKLISPERYQFMDKIGGEPIKTPYVIIRLDRCRQSLVYSEDQPRSHSLAVRAR